MWHRIIECLDVAVEITARAPRVDSLLDAVFRTYRDAAGSAHLSYVIEVSEFATLTRDGQVVRRCDDAWDLVPALEIDLYRTLMTRASGFLLHAGAIVGAGGTSMVFAGESGAGKSTLVRALLERGYAYLTEECVALLPGRQCLGLCRPLHVEGDEISLPADFACDDYPIHFPGELVVRTRLFHPPARLLWRGPSRAAAVLRIDHSPAAPNELEPMTAGEALAALWPLTFRNDPSAVEDAAGALGDVARYRLRSARVDDAVARVLSLAKELDVRPI